MIKPKQLIRRFETKGMKLESSSLYSFLECNPFPVSSVRIAPRWRATLYKHESYDRKPTISRSPKTSRTFNSPGDCEKDEFNDCNTCVRVWRP